MDKARVVGVVLVVAVSASAAFADAFASNVIDISLNSPTAPSYLPAPGQRINLPMYNDASDALGSVSGGGTSGPNNDDVVTLGGFGGQIVLAFDHDVKDSPANPMGLDAIVFGNAFWAGNESQYHWAQFGTIEIMPELNNNGIAGDAPGEQWYIIPGSSLPTGGNYRTETWIRTGDTQPVGTYPAYANWPDSYVTGSHELFPNYQTLYGQDGIVQNPNLLDSDPNNDNEEGYWGYAGYTPTVRLGDRDANESTTGTGDFPSMDPALFYTTPDDPLTVGITAGSGGGDAFDIAWAVDPTTWQPAGLSSFRYIRITTAVDAYLGDPLYDQLGEVSTEVDGVADVRELCDLDGDGFSSLADYDAMRAAIGKQWDDTGFLPTADVVVDNVVDSSDWQAFFAAWRSVHGMADANLDDVVNTVDYTIWADNFGMSNPSWNHGDFNADGAVDTVDYTIWADNFGWTAGSMLVPEPGSAAVLLLAATGWLVRRRTRVG